MSNYLTDLKTLELNTNSPVPLNYQLQEIIRLGVLNGNLVDENGKIPSENELTDRFKVSRITVSHALNKLVDQGILRRERGRGTFVTTNDAENWTGRLMGFSEAVIAIGHKASAVTLAHGNTTSMPEEAQSALGAKEAWQLKRLRYADDIPTAIEDSYFLAKVGVILEKLDLDQLITYRTLEMDPDIVLGSGKQSISAVNAGEEEAKLLEVEVGTALLSLKRVIYATDQTPIEFLEAVYRPDYFQFMIDLKR
jgi:GntR family transcriptional regulator